MVTILLSVVANYDWELQQYDVKNALLYGDLEEKIYMEIPPDFRGELRGKRVCKLKKALYELKQSPGVWFGRFSKAMTIMGYNQSQGNHTLFINHLKLGGVTTLLVYVDDIIVIRNDLEEREALRCQLANEFEIKDLGKLKYFLGIEVAYSKRAIFISQHKYVLDLLKETGKLACKPVEMPIEQNHLTTEASEDEAVDKGMH